MKSFFKRIVVAILTLEARLVLARTRPRIIAITGSVGKTSVKDAVYHALKDTKRIRKSQNSYNSEIGVPLTILGLQNAWNNPLLWCKNILDGAVVVLHPGSYPDVLVLEMGIDMPGDMAKLTSWIMPHIVILTRLPDVPVHVEHFASPEAVSAEKRVLVDALPHDGVLVYNHDDEQVSAVAQSVEQKRIGYGRYAPTDVTASRDEIIYRSGMPEGMRFHIAHKQERAAFSVTGSLGVQHAYNCCAAAAVASVFSVPLQDVAAALETHAPPPGRMRILKGVKNTIIIDDTYNSSPVAAERALLTLKELSGVQRRIAVLGDMLELGRFSVSAHEQVGAQVADTADVLVTVGVRARSIAAGALSYGMSEKNVLQYNDAGRAGKELEILLNEGDAVLIKASQGIRLERVVEELMAEPAQAETLLVRQGDQWKAR